MWMLKNLKWVIINKFDEQISRSKNIPSHLLKCIIPFANGPCQS